MTNTILSRQWETRDCADIAKHLKQIVEHLEIVDRQLATTRDISADLLEACEQAVSLLAPPGCVCGAHETIIPILKAAIAKATGGQ